MIIPTSALGLIFVSTALAAQAPPVAQIYESPSALASDCNQGCRICLNAMAKDQAKSGLNAGVFNALNTFVTQYNANPAASNNSNSLDNFSIFSSNPWYPDALMYGLTYGWTLYGNGGPIIDGSEPTIGCSYSWLNGQIYPVTVENVNKSGNTAVAWTRERESPNKVYATSAIRTPKCTIWFMESGKNVSPPQPYGLLNTLRNYNCSNWAAALSSTTCNGKQANVMFETGSLFALKDEVFDAKTFPIGSWGYNNGKNDTNAWCNFFQYHSTQAAFLCQNKSRNGSLSSNYYGNGSVQTVEFVMDVQVSANNTASLKHTVILNGNVRVNTSSIPIWLNANNGSTLLILNGAIDPTNKTAPAPSNSTPNGNTTNNNGTGGNDNSSAANAAGASILIFIVAGLFTLLF